MEKKIIKINNKDVTIMEQPTSTVLEWEKKYGKDIIEYAKQILKYPSGVNKEITEIFDIPSEIKVFNLVKTYENKEDVLRDCQRLILAGAGNYAFAAEEFVKLVGKNVDEFKFKQLRQMGKEIEDQVVFFAEISDIVETFRNF